MRTKVFCLNSCRSN